MNRYILGLSMAASLVLASTGAFAADDDPAGVVAFNGTGASAQFNLFTSAGPAFLRDQLDCAPADLFVALSSGANSNVNTDEAGDPIDQRQMAIAVCRGSVAFPGIAGTGGGSTNPAYPALAGKTIVIRYTSFASFEGPRSVQGLNPDGIDSGCLPTERYGASNDVGITFVNGTSFTGSDVNNGECVEIDFGASDVRSQTFGQLTSGEINGPCQGGSIFRDVGFSTPEVEPTSPTYRSFTPLAVPFALFMNANPENEIPLNNLSQAQVQMLFSGNVSNWNQFVPDLDKDGTAGEPAALAWDTTVARASTADLVALPASGDSLPVRVCIRHAGSGTAAAFVSDIMRNVQIVQFEEQGAAPFVYFNNGSGEVRNCVAGNCGSANPGYEGDGAVGYADADFVNLAAITGDDTRFTVGTGFLKRIKYNGNAASRANLANGVYDYWNNGIVYQNAGDSAEELELADAYFNDYLSVPANFNLLGGVRIQFWAPQSEVQAGKADDFATPAF